MIYRTITSQGLINISKGLRGRTLARDVALTLDEGGRGLRILPYDPLITYPPDTKFVAFDGRDRLRLPPDMRSDAGLVTKVEISTVGDGSLLLSPVSATCAICGGTDGLKEMREDKYLCTRCIAEAVVIGGY